MGTKVYRGNKHNLEMENWDLKQHIQGTWMLRKWFSKLPKGVGLHAMRAYEEVLMWLSIYFPSFGLLCAITHQLS